MHSLVRDIASDHSADMEQAMAFIAGFLLCEHHHPVWSDCSDCERHRLPMPAVSELAPIRESILNRSPSPLDIRVRSHAMPGVDDPTGTPWYDAPFSAWIKAAQDQRLHLQAWGIWWPAVEMDSYDETRDCGGVIAGYTWYTIKLSHGAHRYVYAERLPIAVHEDDLP
ncbi:hypothetical protein Lesp02_03170 [Lentzea sp. NBRC 105346]|uniref:hypothetical protein n=1 Tax=Lentzea sp. NBRC 105346 TaxID=3032205 RepID=UPI0024A05C3C|nr:hypothetical protein [Lentzea sp. NBRC 105346]GLZ28127.1 hypothetical protein Lesp02_03170 [Lentzea sp. NBRC 105346]